MMVRLIAIVVVMFIAGCNLTQNLRKTEWTIAGAS
jgi:hypothetical protein